MGLGLKVVANALPKSWIKEKLRKLGRVEKRLGASPNYPIKVKLRS